MTHPKTTTGRPIVVWQNAASCTHSAQLTCRDLGEQSPSETHVIRLTCSDCGATWTRVKVGL